MVVVFLLVVSSGHGEWPSVEAEVTRTEIKSYRTGGPPEWALFVDFSYEVGGKRYDGVPVRVFSNPVREETGAHEKLWPRGKTFPIYHHPDKPESTSLSQDGGREAMAVIAALFTPIVLFLGGLAVFVVRQSLKKGDSRPGKSEK